MLIGPYRTLLKRSVVAAAAAPTWTKTAGPTPQDIAFGSTTATFSSQAVNNANTSDVIVVFVTGNADQTPMTGTIGGDDLTLAIADAANKKVSIWTRTGNIYTTPDIVMSCSNAFGKIGISVGVLTGCNATPTSTAVKAYTYAADPQTTGSALTIPTDGFALYCLGSESGNAATHNVGTEDYDLTIAASWSHTSGYDGTPGSFTPSISGFNFAGGGIAAATFGP